MGRGTAQQGYEGSVDNPVLAGGQSLEPIIAHLAMLIRKLADAEHVLSWRAEVEENAQKVEDFFRARWDAPKEPEGE